LKFNIKKESDIIIKTAEHWLADPITRESNTPSEVLVKSLQSLMTKEGSPKKVIGPLIGRIRGMQKSIKSIEKINWVSVNNGQLSLGHRPSTKLGLDLKLQGATHILTLLSEKEGAKAIQKIALQNNMAWLWFPMATANPPSDERSEELAKIFYGMEKILNSNGRIYIHCSAGIHRTGMISYALLRFLDYSEQAGKITLGKLRTVTTEGVGDHRLEWGDNVYETLRR